MHYIIAFFIITFPFIVIPGYYNYTIYKFAFLSIIIIVLLLIYLYRLIIKKNIEKPKVDKTLLYLLIFIFLVTISTFCSVNIEKSLGGTYYRYEGYSALISYSLLFFFTTFLNTNKLKGIINGLIFSAFIIAVYSILQHFLIDPFPRIDTKEGWTRSYGLFGNPNFYGSYLTLMLPLSVYLFLEEKQFFYKYAYFIVSITQFLSLLYTETRSGWFGCFIAYGLIGFYLLFKDRTYLRKYIILSIVFLGIFITVNQTNKKPITQRIEETVTQVEKDVNKGGSGRFFIWKTAIPLLKDYWLFGSGPDTFGEVFPNGTPVVDNYFKNTYVDKAHNDFLQLAVTVGLPALAFYLLFICEIIRNSLRKDFLLYSLSFIIIGYCAQAFFNISVVPVAPFFFFILGITYKISKDQKKA